MSNLLAGPVYAKATTFSLSYIFLIYLNLIQRHIGSYYFYLLYLSLIYLYLHGLY